MIGTVRLLSVNTSPARPLMAGGRRVLSGIGKRAVPGPVGVGLLGLDGDEQADPSVHGGLDKAVYAYPMEHYAYWQQQRRASQHRWSSRNPCVKNWFWWIAPNCAIWQRTWALS